MLMKKEDFVIKIERLNRGFLLSFPISFPDYNFQRIIICAQPLKIKKQNHSLQTHNHCLDHIMTRK